MRVLVLMVLIGLVAIAPRSHCQSADDEAAIVAAALDYVDGWYEGNAERMEKALHPNLAKRIVRTHPGTGKSLLDHMSEATLVEYARAGGGKDRVKEGVETEVTVLDVFEGIATVKIVSVDFVDYAHLAKWNGEWVIINVLWAPLKASGER